MFDSQSGMWSDNPNSPKVPYEEYLYEKVWFAGVLIASMFYGTRETSPRARPPTHPHFVSFILGVVVAVFIQCMTALFDPIYRRGEPIKWGIISYTVAMFLLVTIETAMQLNTQSVSYVDNRECQSMLTVLGTYQGPEFIPRAISITQNIMFTSNNWLADGLLVSSSFSAAFTHPDV